MAHPYTTTVNGLNTLIDQLRSAFPQKVTAETLRKWNIGQNNESSLLATLRFVGIIDEEGNKQSEAGNAFVQHDDTAFGAAFAAIVERAYGDLFSTFGERAWTLPRDRLIAFFRATDHTSARVGAQQALTFQALARQAGKITTTAVAVAAAPRPKKSVASGRAPEKRRAGTDVSAKPVSAIPQPVPTLGTPSDTPSSGPALTVRIELNLPVADDQSVYDRIFRSIRENLISG